MDLLSAEDNTITQQHRRTTGDEAPRADNVGVTASSDSQPLICLSPLSSSAVCVSAAGNALYLYDPIMQRTTYLYPLITLFDEPIGSTINLGGIVTCGPNGTLVREGGMTLDHFSTAIWWRAKSYIFVGEVYLRWKPSGESQSGIIFINDGWSLDAKELDGWIVESFLYSYVFYGDQGKEKKKNRGETTHMGQATSTGTARRRRRQQKYRYGLSRNLFLRESGCWFLCVCVCVQWLCTTTITILVSAWSLLAMRFPAFR
jgi:hypothetical protein